MGFTTPPPGNAPVVVVKDVGGDVHEYAAAARVYIAQGREVRLHECRSACTLALSVPNVCVYPNSVLRFHKAYNPITKAVNDGVSDAMMEAYPPAVRQRIGVLTREYKSLTGAELIRLGVRNCNGGPKIMVARANVGSPSSNPFSDAFGAMFSGVAVGEIPKYSGTTSPVRVEKVRVQVAENERQDSLRQENARQENARQEAARQENARQEALRRELARQESARQESARQESAHQENAQLDRVQHDPRDITRAPAPPSLPRPAAATPPTSPSMRPAPPIQSQPVAAPVPPARPPTPERPAPATPRTLIVAVGTPPSAAAPAAPAPIFPPAPKRSASQPVPAPAASAPQPLPQPQQPPTPTPAQNWRVAEASRNAADSRLDHRVPSPSALAPVPPTAQIQTAMLDPSPRAKAPATVTSTAASESRLGHLVPAPSELAPGQAVQNFRDQRPAEATQAATPNSRLNQRVPAPSALTPAAASPGATVTPPPRAPQKFSTAPNDAPETVAAVEPASPLVRATFGASAMGGAPIGRIAPRARGKILPPTALWGAPIPGAAPTLGAEGFMPFVYRFTLKS